MALRMSISTLRGRYCRDCAKLQPRRVFNTLDGRAAAAKTMSAPGRQRLVVALGGNALLKRGEPLTFANQVRRTTTRVPTSWTPRPLFDRTRAD
jgi:hypothetical protein